MKQSEEKSRILEMVGLYQKDPAAFEKMREELIQATIEELPDDQRRSAYGLQFQLEMRLNRYRDPLMRMNAMVDLFWEQVHKFNRALNDPGGVIAEREAGRNGIAKVLPFKARATKH